MTQEKVTVTSPRYAINWKDAIRGLLVAAITTPLTVIYDSISAGDLSIDWKKMGLVALAGGISYLIKNYLTPATMQMPVADNQINPNLDKTAK